MGYSRERFCALGKQFRKTAVLWDFISIFFGLTPL